MKSSLLALAVLLAACGHTAPQNSGQQYVCYPVDGSAEPPPAPDAGDCQSKAPPGCVLTDLAKEDPGGTSAWCCVDVSQAKIFCCAQP